MAGRGTGPDFVEALARGLDVIEALGAGPMTLAEVATAAELARPTARRLLLTLEELGYVRVTDAAYDPDAARPAARHGVRRCPGPLGGRPPAPRGPGRPHGGVLVDGPARRLRHRVRRPRQRAEDHRPPRRDRHPLPRRPDLPGQGPAGRPAPGRRAARCWPSRASRASRRTAARTSSSCSRSSAQVRARGWALADEELAPGVRSVAVPVRDGTGAVRAAMNVTVHAAETSVRDAARRPPAAPAARGGRGQRRLGAVAGPPARREGGQLTRLLAACRRSMCSEASPWSARPAAPRRPPGPGCRGSCAGRRSSAHRR